MSEPSAPLYPHWAGETFQILMFEVKGLRFAAPLTELQGIVRWDGEACVMPGQPSWQRGVLTHQGELVAVIDMGQLLIPERPASLNPSHTGYLLLVGDGSYGLLVEKLGTIQHLRRGGVQWHHGKDRPWLAGTVIERIAALLKMDGLLAMLLEQD